MFSKLFHKDCFLPKGAQEAVKLLQQNMTGYFLSKHFEEHLNNQDTEDRSHTYLKDAVMTTLNQMISSDKFVRDAFEIELSKDYHYFGVGGWLITKYCIRIAYDSESDLVVVIRPQWDEVLKKYDLSRNMVVTAWINHNKDHHYTLDESKYCSEKEWLFCK